MALPNAPCGSTAANRVLPSACTARTSVRTCCSGVMPSVHTPGRACAASLVSASIGTFAACAIGATAAVSAAVSGPMNRPALLPTAARAAFAAPSGVPPVSSASSGGEPGGASASCTACSIAWPSAAFGPESGRSAATCDRGAGPAGPTGAGMAPGPPMA